MTKLTFKVLGGGIRTQVIDIESPRAAFAHGLGLAGYGETLLSAERTIIPTELFR
jgi:hypothetical protein